MINKIAERLRQLIDTRVARNTLNSLRDHELNDIGITRDDIDNVARGILDVHRTVRDHKNDYGN